jgi:hypothetical protein
MIPGAIQNAVNRTKRTPLLRSGLEIERAMKIVLSNSSGGLPSVPGMPPNRQRGELRSSCSTALTASGNSVVSGATARYARIQDKGGVTHPTVTPRMRAWAWAMYYKLRGAATTAMRGSRMAFRKGNVGRGMKRMADAQGAAGKEGLYLGIALTKKTKLTIKLPPRPFVRPAWETAKGNIMRHWKGFLYA